MKTDELYHSLFAIVTFFVSSKQDAALLARAGVTLEAALFPFLMRVAHAGPLAIGDLADQVGRDYTTVSRQVDKLIERGLLVRVEHAADRRVRKVGLTGKGTEVVAVIREARRTMMREALQDWTEDEREGLQVSLEHLARTVGPRMDTDGNG